ncbi:MAG TPA: hypothetical protein VKB54_07630 [Solirubrobacteraceae bacterium]|nr:hypothetical protein [Solirubrobacteraceae bacterium]
MEHLPIACSLSATELPVRREQMAALGRDALLRARVESAHAELRFAAERGIHARVLAFAAAESECCAFLTMRVDAVPGAVVLSIDAPEGAEPVLCELVEAFTPRQAPATERRAGR